MCKIANYKSYVENSWMSFEGPMCAGGEEILKHMHAYQNSYIKIRSI